MAKIARSLAALALSGVVLAGGYALARGPDMLLPGFGFSSGQSFFSPPGPASSSDGDDQPAAPPKHKHSGGAAFGYGKAVCVRLCDGFFFPTGSAAGGDAACASECPDSPVALYTMPTERIEDAVSSTGRPYTMLPVAKRYQTSVENTCTCHRGTIASRAKEILRDPTLRKGDVVMTANGFRVYEGDGYSLSTDKDFVTLSAAGGVPKDERATLAAMERATASGARAPAAPSLVAARPAPRPKGNVTVDDGDPPPAR